MNNGMMTAVMIKSITLPITVVHILRLLQQAGYEAFIVGGAVRDIILHAQTESSTTIPQVVDWDFTTNATPAQIQQLFPDSFYDNNFGTVGIAHEHLIDQLQLSPTLDFSAWLPATLNTKQRLIDISAATKIHNSLSDASTTQLDSPSLPDHTFPPYEITTYRSESSYQDHRHPEVISWGKSLTEDLNRRDFTINALALNISATAIQQLLARVAPDNTAILLEAGQYQLTDLYQGLADIESGTLRTVGNASNRFTEDALRMLRAVRLSVQLNMAIEQETYQAIVAHSPLLRHISWERIRDELLKILSSHYPAEGIELLDEVGLLDHILPELQLAKGVAQGGHHTTDVWTHSLDALRECPSLDPIVRLATLLHDIAKPETVGKHHGEITFYNHEVVGARTAKAICRRLKLPRRDIDRVFTLVRHHMFYYQPHNSDASIRRFMRKVGLEHVDDILDVREADRLGSGAKKTSWRLEEMKQRMIEQLHQPMDVTDLAINGHDLMQELQLAPGPILGKLLQQLLEQVLDHPELNTKDQLLQLATKLL